MAGPISHINIQYHIPKGDEVDVITYILTSRYDVMETLKPFRMSDSEISVHVSALFSEEENLKRAAICQHAILWVQDGNVPRLCLHECTVNISYDYTVQSYKKGLVAFLTYHHDGTITICALVPTDIYKCCAVLPPEKHAQYNGIFAQFMNLTQLQPEIPMPNRPRMGIIRVHEMRDAIHALDEDQTHSLFVMVLDDGDMLFSGLIPRWKSNLLHGLSRMLHENAEQKQNLNDIVRYIVKGERPES